MEGSGSCPVDGTVCEAVVEAVGDNFGARLVGRLVGAHIDGPGLKEALDLHVA